MSTNGCLMYTYKRMTILHFRDPKTEKEGWEAYPNPHFMEEFCDGDVRPCCVIERETESGLIKAIDSGFVKMEYGAIPHLWKKGSVPFGYGGLTRRESLQNQRLQRDPKNASVFGDPLSALREILASIRLDEKCRTSPPFPPFMCVEDAVKRLNELYPLARRSLRKSEKGLIYAKTGGHCAYCGKKIKPSEMTVDHLVSHTLHSGSDDLDNLLPSCRECNITKWTYTIEEYRNYIERCKEKFKSKPAKYHFYRKWSIRYPHKVRFYFEKMREKAEKAKSEPLKGGQ